MRHERCVVRAGRPVTQLVTKLLDQMAESYTRSSHLSYTFHWMPEAPLGFQNLSTVQLKPTNK